MASRFQVAEYWASEAGAERWPRAWAAVPDLGEPSCFACGYYARTWDKERTVAKRWEVSALDMAHIVSSDDGGLKEPSNLVLLCYLCHAAAPMTLNERDMFAWIDARESDLARTMRLVGDECAALGFRPEDITSDVERCLDVAARGLGGAMHWGQRGAEFSPSTMARAGRAAIDIVRLRAASAAWLNNART